jgi:hypothetical protein
MQETKESENPKKHVIYYINTNNASKQFLYPCNSQINRKKISHPPKKAASNIQKIGIYRRGCYQIVPV